MLKASPKGVVVVVDEGTEESEFLDDEASATAEKQLPAEVCERRRHLIEQLRLFEATPSLIQIRCLLSVVNRLVSIIERKFKKG